MAPAFITSIPASLRPATPLTTSTTSPKCARRVVPRCASVSRPSFGTPSSKSIFDDDDELNVGSGPTVSPELAAAAGAICEFMNREHVRDLANYVVRFGSKFNDMSQLSQVRMTAVDAAGFTADVVSCDESSCVCVQERLAWPLGMCTNPDDIIAALKHLSLACGLPADF